MKVYMLLDQSGSMNTKWEESISAINAYSSKLEGQAKVRLVSFDSTGWHGDLNYRVLRHGEFDGWRNVEYNEVKPDGGTPLYDAFIRLTNEVIYEKEDKAVVVVISDGDENSSKLSSYDDVKKRIKLMEEVAKVPVVFLGAEFNTRSSNYVGTMDVHSLNSTRSMKKGMFEAETINLADQTMNYFDTGNRNALYDKS